MRIARNIFYELKTKIYETLYSNPLRIILKKPIFSFSFDDVPSSAVSNGIPILEKNRIYGTFYISAKLGIKYPNDNMIKNDGFVSLETVRDIHSKGHHIGCHTFSHYRLSKVTADEMVRDCALNRGCLSKVIGETEIEHFSYPFGDLSLSVKRLLRKNYKTMRSTRAGINSGWVDLNLLKAVNIYSINLNKIHIKKIIAKNLKVCGWLIFYTHGVDKYPGEYGTTPEDLSWVINECQNINGEILSIDKAYQKIKHDYAQKDTLYINNNTSV